MDLLELFIFTYYIWYTNKIQKHTFVVSISENRLSSDALAGVIDNQCLLIKIIWLSICSQYFLDDKGSGSVEVYKIIEKGKSLKVKLNES